ncbi:MAG: hypothetical protein AABY06_00435 [Nanoarchaeota archaeon]
MEELIRNNAGLVKQILNDTKISKEVLSNMVKIYALKNDFKSIHFSLEERGLWWEAEIYFKEKIKSMAEFHKYLEMKNFFIKNNTSGYGGEIYRPDYILAMDCGKGRESELRCNFYNPGKISSLKQ